MTQKKIILVTGAAGYWGGRVAARLAGDPQNHVIGLDANLPAAEIKDLDFVQADLRNPLLVDLLKEERVETVAHLAFQETLQPNETAFDFNVLGTMKVLGAAADAAVQKVIVPSSMMVYGALSTNPAFLREERPLKGSLSYGTTRDLVEIESFLNGFRREVPEMVLTVLRFAQATGPTVDSVLTRFLKNPTAPMLWGFDPLMQVIHENDVVEAVVHSVEHDVPGVYNVAAEGNLPLTKLCAIAGKLPLPVFHMFAYWGKDLLDGASPAASRILPFPLDYIRYPWVGDLNRMRSELCFVPHYTAEEALREFAGQQRVSIYRRETANPAYDEERLRDTIERRKRARTRHAAFESEADIDQTGFGEEEETL